jgi:hypothetical protein
VEKLGILLGNSSSKNGNRDGTPLYRMIRMLDKSFDVSYILDSQHKFIYTNPAWDAFAESNDAPHLAGEAIIGSDIFNSVPKVLKPLYRSAFTEVAETGHIWERTYKCSSSDQARRFRMKIYFLERRNWFLVTNSLLVQRPHRKTCGSDSDTYFSRGIVTMCAHCRCSMRVDGSKRWDFVPEYIKLKGMQALKISHGLCPICQAHFYPHL